MDTSSYKRLPPPAKPPISATEKSHLRLRNGYRGAPPTTMQLSCRSLRRHRLDVEAPENRFRRREASKEIVRRALTPPSPRPGWRWRNFRPMPTRFSILSSMP
ncbi:hypothetical protein C2S52_006011 [Perilla frutescens var. hirtella]|nr:hypothetical protein C2S52_006011 [Perilla frutescens var. hirtella]